MIDVDRTKYDPTKSAVISKFKRLPPPKASPQVNARQPEADAVASKFDAGKDGVVLQSVSGGDNAASPDVDVRDIHSGAGRPAGEFSPGKNPTLDLRDCEMSSVACYVRDINGNWQRGVDAFMNVGRLCAEANARLPIAQKSALIKALPFGNTAFSKFVQIGSDTRLYAPEIQRLLPAHYTTTYTVTLLTDEELKRAIAEKVLRPDMTRAQLQRWRNSYREKVVVAPGPNEAASDPNAVTPPTPSTQGVAVSGTLPSTIGDDNRDMREQLAVAPEEAPGPEAVASTAVATTSPPSDEDIPPFLDRRPLSPEDQRAFDAIMTALNSASPVVRERVRAALGSSNAWSGSGAKAESSRRHDDDASATPNPPTGSVVPAYIADAAERVEVKKFEPAGEVPLDAKPEAPDQADAGIKYSDLQVPGFMPTRARPIVVARRKSRRPKKKPRGPFETSPF